MNRKGFCFFLGAISGRATTASESVKAWIGILEISSSPPLSASEVGVDGETGVGRESLPPARDAFFGGRLAGIVVCLGGRCPDIMLGEDHGQACEGQPRFLPFGIAGSAAGSACGCAGTLSMLGLARREELNGISHGEH